MPSMALDQRLKSIARSFGTPIMPAITATGSGVVSAATMSTSTPVGMASASSPASCSIAGRIASIAAGVNALARRPRSTVWRGGSSVSSGKGKLGPGRPDRSPIADEEKRRVVEQDRPHILEAAGDPEAVHVLAQRGLARAGGRCRRPCRGW